LQFKSIARYFQRYFAQDKNSRRATEHGDGAVGLNPRNGGVGAAQAAKGFSCQQRGLQSNPEALLDLI